MATVAENNKRIAKNTTFLYIRLLFTMAVGLYTSRLILSVLGIDDFGLNLVVTSVVTMFDFLNHSMSISTSRFLTFELGRKDFEKLKKTFSASVTVHILIAVVILIICETVGLWYLENKMIVPAGRMTAARWVYQFSIIGAFISIIQTPYNAIIISYEKMNIYAYTSILNSCLRLLIVYLLLIGNFDKLILYSILSLCVGIIFGVFYVIYCLRCFKECKYKFEWNKQIIDPILSLSGWNLLSNIGGDTKDRGVNIILNLFFSTVINAAYGLAFQVFNAINSFYSSFMMAVKPQIVKYYAENRILEMNNLAINATKYSFVLCFTLALPVVIEINFILNLWLENVPDYTTLFCQLCMVVMILNTFWGAINYIVYATGKIKSMSIIIGVVYLLVPIISYLLFKFNCKVVYIPLLINIAISIAIIIIVLIQVRSLISQFSVLFFLKKVILSSFLVATISSILPLFIHFSLEGGWLRLVLVILSSTVMLAVTTYYFMLDRQMKTKIISLFHYFKFKKHTG